MLNLEAMCTPDVLTAGAEATDGGPDMQRHGDFWRGANDQLAPEDVQRQRSAQRLSARLARRARALPACRPEDR